MLYKVIFVTNQQAVNSFLVEADTKYDAVNAVLNEKLFISELRYVTVTESNDVIQSKKEHLKLINKFTQVYDKEDGVYTDVYEVDNLLSHVVEVDDIYEVKIGKLSNWKELVKQYWKKRG